ncbi:MAG: OmpW family outer membrane protein, partial [Gammaproteobacteria bacterium]
SALIKRIGIALLAGSTLLTVSTASAYQAGDWIVRAGAAGVYPTGDGKIKGIPDSKVEADSAWSLGINGTYMATNNIGIGLLGAWPFKHDIDCKDSISAFGTCADTKHLPPTLTVQWHFDTGSKFHPFVGVGVNYTYFFDTNTKGDLKNAGGKLDLDNSWGLAGEIGLDYELANDWLIGGQVYYIDIDTDATLKLPGFKSTSSVSIDPWVYMISVGKKF